jgi:5-methylthioadenosine/S-adenosylhomocysteine deaminase
MGHFLEIKSRTWSSKDAERKSELAAELVSLLGASAEEAVSEDYVEIAKAAA